MIKETSPAALEKQTGRSPCNRSSLPCHHLAAKRRNHFGSKPLVVEARRHLRHFGVRNKAFSLTQ
jgi:hypothetical protein